ncbi:hypothetical protein [Jatrophihabitans sp.]|uniref:hypothetical protein n=1 Tax=Jatrophihabitans sp. TaxID=1932789 RepID=UPI002C0BAD3C|nr:hypothetical protein [Jatrophihabitans sp.]
MTGVPADGTAVVLRDQRGGAYRSEVAGAQDGVLFLSPPRDLASGAFPPGTRLLVAWPDETSLRVLPVLLLNVTTDGRLAVQIQGAAWREERRRYARTNLDATLSIGYDRGDGQQVEAGGELIDLSEAALRGIVAQDHQALRRPRTPVRVRIELADDSFDISGYVLQGKPTARLDLGIEVVVLFHRPVPRVEELRRHLSGLVPGGS